MKTKQDCFCYMAAHDDSDASDGAWQAMLEDSVREFNKTNGTNYSPFDMFMEYVAQGNENAFGT